MANRTESGAKQIHGMNPQFLIDTILRNKIYNTLYWKEKCFALTSETIIDRAVELKFIGGTYGGNKHPTDFICLVLKMLQIQPNEEIIDEYLSDECADYKYLRALAAFYVRLTAKSSVIYAKLEPLYNDYRKLRVKHTDGTFSIVHMDEYIEDLLHKEDVFEVTLPKLPKRKILEVNGELESRVSILEADLDLDQLMNEGIAKPAKETHTTEEEYDDFADVNLDKLDKLEESESESEESEGRKKNIKKRKIDREETGPKETSEKKLDPESAEYWLEMRKKLGLK